MASQVHELVLAQLEHEIGREPFEIPLYSLDQHARFHTGGTTEGVALLRLLRRRIGL